MALSKGDLVIVNFTKFGHNVVNAICKVEEVHAGYDQTHQTVRMHVKAEQGNNTPNQGIWTLTYPSEHCMPYLPPVKVGDIVKITGMMDHWVPGTAPPDERGCLAKITGKGISQNGETYYKLKVEGNAVTWAYPRESFSLDMEAELQANVPPKSVAPAIKYKCINPRRDEGNPRKENISGLL